LFPEGRRSCPYDFPCRHKGIRSDGAEGAELLGQAVAAYHKALEVFTREQLPQEWATTQQNLGAALAEQGKRSEGAKAGELLNQAVAADRSALEVLTREKQPQQWASTKRNLGRVFYYDCSGSGGENDMDGSDL